MGNTWTDSLTLTSGQVAEALNYYEPSGQPNRRLIRTLAKKGKLPPPIDMELSVPHWRWSRAEVEAYVAGTWRAAS